MSLLREIQDAAVDGRTDISTLLRKCLVLATRLRNEDFKKWVEWELNGYPSKEHLPKYRIYSVSAYGNFAGGFGAALKHTPIPSGCLPEKFRDLAATHYDLSPISASAQLLVNSEKGGSFQMAWPADIIAMVAGNVYKGYRLIAAWNEVPRGSIEAAVDSVRNRVLALVLQLEDEAPDAGESSTPKLSQDRITQMFTTNIYGNVGNVVSGNRDVTQAATVQVTAGDLESLKQHLASQGIGARELAELETAIKADGPQSEGFGHRVGAWIGKMIGQAGKGTWKIATAVAAAVLTKAIAAYYGLPGSDGP